MAYTNTYKEFHANFIMPENTQRFKSEQAKIYGYIFEKDGKYYSLLFTFQAKKKFYSYYHFKDKGKRFNYITNVIETRIQAEKEKQEWKQQKNKATTLKPGDILYTSWGYDQTNTEFYKVLEVLGKRKVKIVELQRKLTKIENMTGSVVPVDKEKGTPFTKWADGDNTVKINSVINAYPWNGKEKAISWYG